MILVSAAVAGMAHAMTPGGTLDEPALVGWLRDLEQLDRIADRRAVSEQRLLRFAALVDGERRRRLDRGEPADSPTMRHLDDLADQNTRLLEHLEDI